MTQSEEPFEPETPAKESTTPDEAAQNAESDEQDERYVNVTSESARPQAPRQASSGLRKALLLLMLPVITALVILVIIKTKTDEVIVYETGLLRAGEQFVKYLAEDNVGDAFEMLMPALKERTAAETLEADYMKAVTGAGGYVGMASHKWGPARNREAPNSYTARFTYEKGAMQATLAFTPVKVGSEDAEKEYRIRSYSFEAVP